MIFFITADAIAIIILLIVLIVAGLGVTIAMAIKEILFLLAVGLALFSCFCGLLSLLEEVCQEELRGINLKSIIVLFLSYILICFSLFSLPKKLIVLQRFR